MSESTTTPQAGSLSDKKLPELKQLASSMGIKGAGALRKQELIDAIRAAGSQASAPRQRPARETAEPERTEAQPVVEQSSNASVADEVGARLEQLSQDPAVRDRRRQRNNRQQGDQAAATTPDEGESESQPQRQNNNRQNQPQQRQQQGVRDDDEGTGSRRSRRRRQRDRPNRRTRGGGNDFERLDDPVVSDDDVLIEVAGILDVLDNYAFVRTSGYLPGPNDAYVSLSMVRKNDLRKGDVITGAIRAPREGERKEKFNPLVRLDTVNGTDPERMRQRPEFAKLTPLYPQERLKLETTPTNMTGRIVDLVSPIGKGQRGLIVSPPKAGKTIVLQQIANAITTNNPEVYLMVVLVDERPEEVTDFQRTTTGEVIASTFDRPAEDHTTIAELAVERAKRLVELGHDVVILLDGITRLGRAYNQAAPASGRILSGGVDSAALYPPKKFFGAARNIEHGGSLTILATALVETGSKMDEVIFEEFKGTGNSEIVLDRKVADKRIFPSLDVGKSGTRKEELLVDKTKLSKMWVLRRILMQMGTVDAMEFLLDKIKDSKTNEDFFDSMNQ